MCLWACDHMCVCISVCMNIVCLISWCMFQVCSQEVQWTPHPRFWYHYYESGSSNRSFTHLDLEIILLPSALARGSESRIYSHKVCMYVCTCMVGYTQECHAECCYIPLVWGICASHSLTHSDTDLPTHPHFAGVTRIL